MLNYTPNESWDADRTADFCRQWQPPLLERVAQRFNGQVDEQLIASAVEDVLLDHCRRPRRFDPSHGHSLLEFLTQAAARNTANLLKEETRRKARERIYAKNLENFVENDGSARNIIIEAAEHEQAGQRLIDALLALLPDPVDKGIFLLMDDGVHASQPYAQLLRIGHLPAEQQRALVYRAKERIIKYLRRNGAKLYREYMKLWG